MDAKIEDMINLYFDGELNKNKEPILFSLLAGDEEARNYFKQANSLKTNIGFTMEEFPINLEKKILYNISERTDKEITFFQKKNFAYASYTAAIIFLVLTVFMFFKSMDYQAQIQNVSNQLQTQKEEINLLINSLPAGEVNTSYENAVVVKANL